VKHVKFESGGEASTFSLWCTKVRLCDWSQVLGKEPLQLGAI